jgi:hypothetical protein
MGFKHPGNGFCTYDGHWRTDALHGEGTFTCCDGRRYVGGWQDGKRHGEGMQVMCPLRERGDTMRHHIGGIDGMYRIVLYEGAWDDGERTGEGEIEYADGLRIRGVFARGRLEGCCEHFWASGAAKVANWKNGNFVDWDLAESAVLQAKLTAANFMGAGVGTSDRRKSMLQGDYR